MLIGARLLEFLFWNCPDVGQCAGSVGLAGKVALLHAKPLKFGPSAGQLRGQLAGLDVVVRCQRLTFAHPVTHANEDVMQTAPGQWTHRVYPAVGGLHGSGDLQVLVEFMDLSRFDLQPKMLLRLGADLDQAALFLVLGRCRFTL